MTDTIVAVSSPSWGLRSIIRITGPETLRVCEQIFHPRIGSPACSVLSAELRAGQPRTQNSELRTPRAQILSGVARVGEDLTVDARLYVFFAPHSYTGEPLAEIHIHASQALAENLLRRLLAERLRPAGPGEFTARAYLAGKLDLAQAEAVNEIISSSNRLQLDAAEKLLCGRLRTAIREIRSALLDCLSLIEAGLDFSGEDIELISGAQATERLTCIQTDLRRLLAGSIRYESLVELPAVGIAGAPNAGKSSLLNAVLGRQRSIVSDQRKTTRDVLSGVLTTDRFQCVLFDCAGLTPETAGHRPQAGDSRRLQRPDNLLDELTQRAAIEALRGCLAVIFCVDSAKPHWGEDIGVHALIAQKNVIHVAAKADLLGPEELSEKIKELTGAFGAKFLPTSSKTGHGLRDLRHLIRKAIHESTGPEWQPQAPRRRGAALEPSPGSSALTCACAGASAPRQRQGPPPEEQNAVALTARHQHAVTEALDHIRQAIGEIGQGNEEVAAMMIRTAYQAVSEIEQQHINEQVLDRIFRRFCIGK